MRVSANSKAADFARIMASTEPLFKANSLRVKDDSKKAPRKLGGGSVNSVNRAEKPDSQRMITSSSRNLVPQGQADLMIQTPRMSNTQISSKMLRSSNGSAQGGRRDQTTTVQSTVGSLSKELSPKNAGLHDRPENYGFKSSRNSINPNIKNYKPLFDDKIIEQRGRSLGVSSGNTSRDNSRMQDRAERLSNTSQHLNFRQSSERSSHDTVQVISPYLQKIGSHQGGVTNVYSISRDGVKTDVSLNTAKQSLLASFDRGGQRAHDSDKRKLEEALSELSRTNSTLNQNLMSTRAELQAKVAECNSLRAELNDKQTEVQNKTNSLQRALENLEGIKSQFSSVQAAYSSVANSQPHRDIGQLLAENEYLKKELNSLSFLNKQMNPNGTGSSSTHRSDVEHFQAELNKQKAMISSMQSELAQKNSQIAQLKSKHLVLPKTITIHSNPNHTDQPKDQLAPVMNQYTSVQAGAADEQVVKQRFIIRHLIEKIQMEEKRAENLERDFLKAGEAKVNERHIAELTQLLESKQLFINELMAKEGGCKTARSKTSASSGNSDKNWSQPNSQRNTARGEGLAESLDLFNFKKSKENIKVDSSASPGEVNASEKIEWYRQMKRNSKLKLGESDLEKESEEVAIQEPKDAAEVQEDVVLESRRDSVANSEESISKIITQYK